MDIRITAGHLELNGYLFDIEPARSLYKLLPVTIDATFWGQEFYGSLPEPLEDAGKHLQAKIKPGGIAYSEQGNYLCVFFGQTPAWPVDYLGHIANWQRLNEISSLQSFLVAAVG